MSAINPSASAAVVVERTTMVFNEGRSNQVDALTDIDLTVSPRDFVALIGPSGCGKSTLLRLIANLIEPTTGTVLVNGKSARQSRLDQDYGMAFQQSGLFEWRTVRKNIELPLELKGWGKSQRRERADEMLRRLSRGDLSYVPAVLPDRERWALDDSAETMLAAFRERTNEVKQVTKELHHSVLSLRYKATGSDPLTLNELRDVTGTLDSLSKKLVNAVKWFES